LDKHTALNTLNGGEGRTFFQHALQLCTVQYNVLSSIYCIEEKNENTIVTLSASQKILLKMRVTGSNHNEVKNSLPSPLEWENDTDKPCFDWSWSVGVCAGGGGGVTVYVGESIPKRQRRSVLFPSVNFGQRQYS
jgi:hypothetical protein